MKLNEFKRASEATRPAVVLSDDEVALPVVRDLGRQRIPTLLVTPGRDNAARFSRYCAVMMCSSLGQGEEKLIADLEAIGATLPQRGVLFSCDDDYLVAVSRHRAPLEAYYDVPLPEWERLRALSDKEQQLLLAQAAGVATPISSIVRDVDDFRAALEAVPFPCLLKPIVARDQFRAVEFKVVVAQTRGQLEEAYTRHASSGPFLLQEIIPGGDEQVWIAGTYHDAASRCVARFTGRKLRQHPRGFGVARLCESRWSDEVADLADRVLTEARYHGVADVEFKRDPRDGRLKFMEINARQGYWVALPTAAGVNLSLIAYADVTGATCAPFRQRDGVRWIDALHDAPDSIREIRRGELSVREWISPLAGVRADAYLSVRDPRPGLYAMLRMARWHLTTRT